MDGCDWWSSSHWILQLLFADRIFFLQRPRGLHCDSPIGACQKTFTTSLFTADTPAQWDMLGRLSKGDLNLLQRTLSFQAFWVTQQMNPKIFPSETYAASKIWISLLPSTGLFYPWARIYLPSLKGWSGMLPTTWFLKFSLVGQTLESL